MISEHDRLLMVDEVETKGYTVGFLYRSTYALITKALKWSIAKDKLEIEKRIIICEGKREQQRMQIMKNNWQLIIETLKWVIEETETEPLESRRNLVPFA